MENIESGSAAPEEEFKLNPYGQDFIDRARTAFYELVAQEITPSVRVLRDKMGGGSQSWVADVLRNYRKTWLEQKAELDTPEQAMIAQGRRVAPELVAMVEAHTAKKSKDEIAHLKIMIKDYAYENELLAEINDEHAGVINDLHEKVITLETEVIKTSQYVEQLRNEFQSVVKVMKNDLKEVSKAYLQRIDEVDEHLGKMHETYINNETETHHALTDVASALRGNITRRELEVLEERLTSHVDLAQEKLARQQSFRERAMEKRFKLIFTRLQRGITDL